MKMLMLFIKVKSVYINYIDFSLLILFLFFITSKKLFNIYQTKVFVRLYITIGKSNVYFHN
jgi:hypothetical protein